MTIYGNTSRVSVETIGGGIAGVSGGTEQKVVLFARGDPANGSASTNDPTQVSGPGELDSTFGTGTRIVEYFKQIANNGIAYEKIWGVMPALQSVSNEAASAVSSYTLNNAPVLKDLAEITIEEDTSGDGAGDTAITVEKRYESPPATPGDADTAYLNPNTGELEFDSSGDYYIDYKYLDWSSAFDSATDVVKEQEVGTWAVGSEADSVVSTANSKKDPLRIDQWKMVNVFGLAQPNQTGTDSGAEIDVANYTDSLDDDSSFIVGPGRISGSTTTVIGAVTGIAAGNPITDPIIGDELEGIDELEQTLDVAKQEALENEQVIPLSNAGDPSIEGNLSTSTASDWLRSYFARRLADRLILAARAIAKETRGKLNSENTETLVEQQLSDEIEDLIDQNVLRPNVSDEQRWFVTADQDPNDARELDLSFGFTPTGVVDVVDVTQTINY